MSSAAFFDGHVHLVQYFKSQHYLKSGYIIQLIALQWDTACTPSSPDPSFPLSEVSLACETT